MNGRRARQIRGLAWSACLEAATRTGDRRFLSAANLKLINRRIKRHYRRSGTFPTSVERKGMHA